MTRKFDVLNEICRRKFGIWWPEYMAHQSLYGIQDLSEFTDVLYEAMETYSKQNVKAKEKSHREIIDEMNKIFDAKISEKIKEELEKQKANI